MLNRKGDKLRTVNIKSIETLVCDVTQDTNSHRGGSGKKPMVLVRVQKDHDLVLEFGYPGERKKFLAKLENFLTVRARFVIKLSRFVFRKKKSRIAISDLNAQHLPIALLPVMLELRQGFFGL